MRALPNLTLFPFSICCVMDSGSDYSKNTDIPFLGNIDGKPLMGGTYGFHALTLEKGASGLVLKTSGAHQQPTHLPG
jgi:hypothetical protein